MPNFGAERCGNSQSCYNYGRLLRQVQIIFDAMRMLDVKPGSSPGVKIRTMQMLDAIAGSSPVAMVSSRGKY